MTGRECFVLPTSETPLRRAGDEHVASDPPRGTSAQSAPARASAPDEPNTSDGATSASENAGVPAAEFSRAETLVTNPMLADTRVQPAARPPETYSASIPAGARLFRVGSGEAVAILDGVAVIGRDRESDLVVSGPAVSRRHSIVRRSIRGYVLTDVSRNGTFVNGRRVRGARHLRAGDVLRIGDEEFRFEVSRATPYAGVALPALLSTLLRQRLAQLRSTVLALADVSRRLGTVMRLRAEPVVSRLGSVSRLAWNTLLRTFWTVWARAAFAWKARSRRS